MDGDCSTCPACTVEVSSDALPGWQLDRTMPPLAVLLAMCNRNSDRDVEHIAGALARRHLEIYDFGAGDGDLVLPVADIRESLVASGRPVARSPLSPNPDRH